MRYNSDSFDSVRIYRYPQSLINRIKLNNKFLFILPLKNRSFHTLQRTVCYSDLFTLHSSGIAYSDFPIRYRCVNDIQLSEKQFPILHADHSDYTVCPESRPPMPGVSSQKHIAREKRNE